MGGSTAYMGVKSNNHVKPNNLVEVRLSCGCVGVLTISLWSFTMGQKKFLVGLTLGMVDSPPPENCMVKIMVLFSYFC